MVDQATGILPQIEHVVHLMLENRSLDNLLGWLYANAQPGRIVPPGGPGYDGVARIPPRTLPYNGTTYPILRGVGGDGTTVPNLDPNEEYRYVLNQLFGDGNTSVYSPPPDGTPAGMQGFLQDFEAWWESTGQWLQITETYTEKEIPVIYGLARQYAVSDRWFCSMPTQTNPNRAFSLCGTSLGRLTNLHEDAVEQFDTPTIWNALYAKRVSMGLFFHETWESGQCYTQYTFPQMNKVDPAALRIVQIADANEGFWVRAHLGTLPAFSYIEPKWGYGESYETCVQGNDYHPPTDVTCGEKLLYDVYTALSANKARWPKTLLIVTFDEHGGTYDHYAPPWGATNPGDPGSLKSPFNFHLFGVRVPTLLVSPYITPGTVFRSPTNVPYDHTSVLATLLRWKGIDPRVKGPNYLYDRTAVAPTFEGVLGPTPVNPGIDLPDPGGCTLTEADRILEGVSAADKRRIVLKARSLDEVREMAAALR